MNLFQLLRMLTFWIFAILILSMIPVSVVSDQEDEVFAFMEPFPEIEGQEDRNVGSKDGFFVENKGQWDDDIGFMGETGFGRIALTETGILYEVIISSEIPVTNGKEMMFDKMDTPSNDLKLETHVLKYEFMGSNDAFPVGTDEMTQVNNYFIGNDPDRWATGVRCFGSVVYEDIWDGIDLKYYFSANGPKYDLILHPDSDPEDIGFKIIGMDDLHLDEDVNIMVNDQILISDSDLAIFYQEEPSERIPGRFTCRGNDILSFDLETYDRSRTIVIDPLVYSAHIGGTSNDYCFDVISDSAGNAYITGSTWSDNFPSTIGAHSPQYTGDVFLTKLSPSGDSITFSTFIGGGNADFGFGIDFDKAKNIYLTGKTKSSTFPVTPGCFQETKGFDYEVFVVKMNPRGERILYGTFVGGNNNEEGLDIAVSSDGEAYVTGHCEEGDFPTTTGAFMEEHSDDHYPHDDAFVFKLNAQGSDMIYSTYLGGDGTDVGFSIELDDQDRAIVGGWDYSEDFPMANGSTYDRNTKASGFIVKFNKSGSGLVFSTVFGGTGSDMVKDIDIGPGGWIIATGRTDAENFPITENAYDTEFNGENDLFVTVFDPEAGEILYSTYFGGNKSDGIYHSIDYGYKQRVRTDNNGNIYVSSETYSPDLPTTDNAYMTENQGDRDVYVAVFDPSLSHLYYCSYLGSERRDYGAAMDIDNLDRPIMAGTMDSSNFPILAKIQALVSNKLGFPGFSIRA